MKLWMLCLFSLCISLHATYTIVEEEGVLPKLALACQNQQTRKCILDNGMHLFLVSDPHFEESAASLTVQVGSWQDPVQHPGMAHFLEHMLFMGNAAYPEENGYMEYIQSHGGNMNAFTTSDRTAYMFSIQNDAFEGALDRFSHFFIDPLFSPSCLERELCAVDQEHAKNVESDQRREHMVLKDISIHDHPYHKFSTGNRQTLEKIPRKEVLDWYERHYSADRMHVIVFSPLSIDELTELAVRTFAPIMKRNTEPLIALANTPLLSKKGELLAIQSIGDLRNLTLLWELPSALQSMTHLHMSSLLQYILEQSSANSLLSTLRNEHLINDIHVGIDRPSQDHAFFFIRLALTHQGLADIDSIILRCFAMLARCKETGVSEEIAQERLDLDRLHYQYPSRQEIFAQISLLAYFMPSEELATFPEKTSLAHHIDLQALSDLLAHLTPKDALVLLHTDLAPLGITPTHLEPWMQVPYACSPIAPSTLTMWEAATPTLSLQLPSLNPFIPRHLHVIQETLATPTLIQKTPKSTCYLAHDLAYPSPEMAMLFVLKSPCIDGSCKAHVCIDLFIKAFQEQLSEVLFFSEEAGISTQMHAQNNVGLHIACHGYSDNVPQFAKTLFSEMSTFSISKEAFSRIKATLISFYINKQRSLPLYQAINTACHLLIPGDVRFCDKEHLLETLSYEEFQEFYSKLFSSIFIEGTLCGNITKVESEQLMQELLKPFAASAPYRNHTQKQIRMLPEQGGPFCVKETTDRQGNGLVLTIQQDPFSFQSYASQQILANLLQERFFATLRTKQQTAYMAFTWASEEDHKLSQTFCAQSSTHLPEDLLARFELFLEEFVQELASTLSEERFLQLKNTEIASLKKSANNLSDFAIFVKELAFVYNEDFLHKQKKIDALEALSYEQLLKDGQRFFSKENRRRLAVLVTGRQTSTPFMYHPFSCETALNFFDPEH